MPFACLIEHVELVETHLDLGADVSIEDNMPLSPAAKIPTIAVSSAIRERPSVERLRRKT